jgi:hypothetical protein
VYNNVEVECCVLYSLLFSSNGNNDAKATFKGTVGLTRTRRNVLYSASD